MVTNTRRGSARLVLTALAALAAAPRGMATSSELAERIGVHAVVVRRLLASVRDAGLVESRGGRAGGWALARDPGAITLADVVRLTAEPVEGGATRLESVLVEAESAYIERLQSTTLAQVAHWPSATPRVTK